MSDRKILNEISYRSVDKDIDIAFFAEDPDYEDGRAGDGYYYKYNDGETWSGPYHSDEEAEKEAREELHRQEMHEIQHELKTEGFIKSFDNWFTLVCFSKLKDSVLYQVMITEKEDVVATYTNMIGVGEIYRANVGTHDSTGYLHQTIREACEKIREMDTAETYAPKP